MIVGGIDPGAKGAMVFVDNGEIVAEHPFTTIGKEPDLDAIMDCFYSAKRLGGIHKIYLEKVHGRPLCRQKLSSAWEGTSVYVKPFSSRLGLDTKWSLLLHGPRRCTLESRQI